MERLLGNISFPATDRAGEAWFLSIAVTPPPALTAISAGPGRALRVGFAGGLDGNARMIKNQAIA